MGGCRRNAGGKISHSRKTVYIAGLSLGLMTEHLLEHNAENSIWLFEVMRKVLIFKTWQMPEYKIN